MYQCKYNLRRFSITYLIMLPMYLTISSKPNYLNILCVLVIQSCPTLCNPMDCSLPGSFVYEILQARILEWVASSFSRESS